MFKNSKKLLSSKGQTSVEYIFMLAVSAVLVKSASGIIQDRLIGDAGKCTKQSESILCKFENITNFGNFRYFTLKH